MKLLKLAGVLLLIPLLALIVSLYYEGTIDSTIRSELLNAYPEISKEKLNEITVENIIFQKEKYGDPGFDAEIYLFVGMKYGSLGSILLGTLLILFVLGMSKLGSVNRKTLGSVFPTTVGISTFLISLLNIVNGILLVAALYYGESAALGIVHTTIIGLIGLGAIIGSFMILGALISARKTTPLALSEEPISKESPVYALVEKVAGKLNTSMPDHLFHGAINSFFAYEGRVQVDNQDRKGRILYLSKEISSRLTEDELSAIVAHEFAHFIGQDLEYTTKFHFAYQALGKSIAKLFEAESIWMLLPRFPAIFLLDFIFDMFGKVERKYSRERELAADKVAFDNYGPQTFGSGLVKAVILMETVEKAVPEIVEMAQNQNFEEDLSPEKFAAALTAKVTDLVQSDLSEVRKELAEKQFPHPFDTHPTMAERLENAGLDAKFIDQVVLI